MTRHKNGGGGLESSSRAPFQYVCFWYCAVTTVPKLVTILVSILRVFSFPQRGGGLYLQTQTYHRYLSQSHRKECIFCMRVLPATLINTCTKSLASIYQQHRAEICLPLKGRVFYYSP